MNHNANRMTIADQAESIPPTTGAGVEQEATAIVTRLEVLWEAEEEHGPEGSSLFVQLCNLIGEQAAFERIDHFAC